MKPPAAKPPFPSWLRCIEENVILMVRCTTFAALFFMRLASLGKIGFSRTAVSRGQSLHYSALFCYRRQRPQASPKSLSGRPRATSSPVYSHSPFDAQCAVRTIRAILKRRAFQRGQALHLALEHPDGAQHGHHGDGGDAGAAVQRGAHGDVLEEQALKDHDKVAQRIQLAQIL